MIFVEQAVATMALVLVTLWLIAFHLAKPSLNPKRDFRTRHAFKVWWRCAFGPWRSVRTGEHATTMVARWPWLYKPPHKALIFYRRGKRALRYLFTGSLSKPPH